MCRNYIIIRSVGPDPEAVIQEIEAITNLNHDSAADFVKSLPKMLIPLPGKEQEAIQFCDRINAAGGQAETARHVAVWIMEATGIEALRAIRDVTGDGLAVIRKGLKRVPFELITLDQLAAEQLKENLERAGIVVELR